MTAILFVANSKKRYRYFLQIAGKLGSCSKVIKQQLPFWRSLIRMRQTLPVCEVELMRIHFHRQQINYPILTRSSLLAKAYETVCLAVERARYHYYLDIFNQSICDTVVIWNGQKQPYSTVVKAARRANKKILFMENGLLPNTTTADFSGVNAKNCLPRDAHFYRSLCESKGLNQSAVELTVRPPSKHQSNCFVVNRKLPDNYIFIPFQVPSDTQIVAHSSWITSMDMLFECLAEVHQTLKQRMGENTPNFVFKEHPSWKGSFGHLHHTNPACIFANGNNTQALIEGAQAVITINSTAGLEALLLNQKVITLGQAGYTMDELVLQASSEVELISYIEQLDSWVPDQSLRQNFISFLQDTYCIPGAWQDNMDSASDEHLNAMVERILEKDTLATYLFKL